jgi:hypothetical protein
MSKTCRSVSSSSDPRRQPNQSAGALGESKYRFGAADEFATRLGIHRTAHLSRIKKFGMDPAQYS